ncbi:YjjG family noncanonical pyrimidine nucleotidase [Ruminococcaceae bacterium OttesenSCG-928-A16]|nr:YjjG family noncanonical pyrimidine nucleotidase [Ruminococcaceae bacterium OttesenSCG-928-A16]
MAANYYCLLLDLDGTLLDFKAAEREAITEILVEAGLESGQQQAEEFSEINSQLWAALERGEIKKEQLGPERFARFLVATGQTGNAAQLNKIYMDRLATKAMPMPGARELLEELAEFATLAVISNGNQRIQLSRLQQSGLMPYFDEIFVSEKLGVNKPSAKFFDLALKYLGIKNREKVLVIGDSLTADIQGGINARLDTCWCNFTGEENHAGVTPTYTVQNFMQLKLVAIGEEELKLAENREKKHLV